MSQITYRIIRSQAIVTQPSLSLVLTMLGSDRQVATAYLAVNSYSMHMATLVSGHPDCLNNQKVSTSYLCVTEVLGISNLYITPDTLLEELSGRAERSIDQHSYLRHGFGPAVRLTTPFHSYLSGIKALLFGQRICITPIILQLNVPHQSYHRRLRHCWTCTCCVPQVKRLQPRYL